MKQLFTRVKGALYLLLFYGVFNSPSLRAQAVTEIITDYQGYWKSGIGNINPIKPQNSHNLVSFTYNGTRYSTGVNDALLTTNGQVFSPQDFQALPFLYFTGTPTSSTFIGLGQLYDGVNNGGSVPPPINNIPMYLTDGAHGLDLGTCVANIPTGNINFGVSGMQAASIGDGIPDILISQIAQPSGANDQYSFRDADGNIVGNTMNIVLANITPVGNWVADFYQVNSVPMVIPGGFVNTERPIRFWAADLSDFGITPANYQQIVSFGVGLKGTSDLAFIAYNFNTVTVVPLPAGIALQKDGVYVDSNNNCIADAGDTINYSFTVTNTGEDALTNIMVNDPLVTLSGSALATLAPGATNSTNFTGTHTITAAEAAAGAVYNLANVTATDSEGQALNNSSVDPTPISSSSPFYNEQCPNCTVTVLPTALTAQAPAALIVEGCSTSAITGLVYSETAVSISVAQYLLAGGVLSVPAAVTGITYQDTVSGTCPLNVTRTFTISGCSSLTVQQTITVGDSVDPTASNPAQIDVVGCGTAFPAPDTSVVLDEADNCDASPEVAFVSDSAPVFVGCQETIMRTYSVTDNCGNSIVVTQVLTRTNDTVLPTATAPADIVIVDFNQPFPNPDVNLVTDEADNCSTPTVTYGGDSQPVLNGCNETIVRTYLVTDACQNVLELHQNITRSFDNTDPVANLSPIVSPCGLTVPAATAVDACAGVITGTTTDPTTFTTPGVYTINWTFDDGNGNTTTAQQTVTIDPSALPQIGDLPAITAECNPVITAPVVTNPCTDTQVTGTTTSPTTFTGDGTYTIVWHFDFDGTDVTANQSVVIDDVTNPVLPSLSTIEFDCFGTVTDVPVATDSCAGTITGTTSDSLVFNTPGMFNITWTFDDGNGNIDSTTQTVIVNAVAPTAPVLSPIVMQCPAPITAPTIEDPCTGGTITGTTLDNVNPTTEGSYTITWTFAYGNAVPPLTVTATQDVTIDDTQSPVQPTLANATASCTIHVDAPTTTDNCAGTVTGTTSDPVDYSVAGTYTINWEFNDGNGNASVFAQQTVIVTNPGAPVLPTLPTLTGECSVTAGTAPQANDPCTGALVTATPDQTSFTSQGTFTITWTYVFSTGTVQDSQQVIVQDVTPPTAPALAALSQDCDITVPTPTATDNCSGTVTATTTDPLTYNVAGTYTVNWLFTDANGLTSTAQQSVTVTTPATQNGSTPDQCNADESAIVDLTDYLPAGIAQGGTFSDPANTGALQGSNFVPLGLAVGNYTINYTVTVDSCEQTAELAIAINDDCIVLPACSVLVHNAITPNGDGENDTMIIDGLTDGCYTDNSIEVYNRWGILVYEARQYNNTSVVFRGQSEGRATLKKDEELPAGTYFYILKYTDVEGKVTEKSSYLYISR
ncbi:gliding motility-associated C-terminal domain-containing protein [Flavobacterium silvaticum]|uniref:Gliding motility-associated C-terminal domain-containing protein n=1 Tax=Flavobacterium silvaticum TaxID=1852020 RepID=A0A972FML8_9FLAO|nr:gliding motility-associated C-terminal domain-containing protein [Flavobacterium silvaticum]NMH28839.1 gliding motility-associated C-terminal domain-containing protein [Flavobacterium silvaticum]